MMMTINDSFFVRASIEHTKPTQLACISDRCRHDRSISRVYFYSKIGGWGKIVENIEIARQWRERCDFRRVQSKRPAASVLV